MKVLRILILRQTLIRCLYLVEISLDLNCTCYGAFTSLVLGYKERKGREIL